MGVRYFVNLLGKGDVEETLDHLEEHHGSIVHDEHGRMNAKLHRSLCRHHIYGIVEIVPKKEE